MPTNVIWKLCNTFCELLAKSWRRLEIIKTSETNRANGIILDTARRVPTNYYTISHKFLTPCHDDRLYITLYYFGLSRNTLNFDNLLISLICAKLSLQ